jgi:hypothetical protein
LWHLLLPRAATARAIPSAPHGRSWAWLASAARRTEADAADSKDEPAQVPPLPCMLLSHGENDGCAVPVSVAAAAAGLAGVA